MDENRRVFAALAEAARHGRRVALATVVRTRGSTPREVGSKLLWDPNCGVVGTVGGGCGEAAVLEAAREVVATGRPRLVRVELTESWEAWSPAVCGGVFEVWVEPR